VSDPRLDRPGASFETRPSGAPQDEENFSMPSTTCLILRRACGA